MRLEKNYYDESRRLLEEVEKEEEERKVQLTEEERAKEKAWASREADRIRKLCEEANKGTFRVITADRLEEFQAITEMSQFVAALKNMNITAQTCGKQKPVGKIEFVTDSFFWGMSPPRI